MADLTIKVNDRQIEALLGELAERYDDLSPVMEAVAAEMEAEVERAFEFEQDPTTGERWKPLSAARLRQRQKREGGSIRILNVQGGLGLAGSIVTDSGKRFAGVGVAKEYGVYHQFGYTVTRTVSQLFGRPLRNPVTFTVTLPARPFLGLGPQAIGDIVQLLERYLARGLS